MFRWCVKRAQTSFIRMILAPRVEVCPVGGAIPSSGTRDSDRYTRLPGIAQCFVSFAGDSLPGLTVSASRIRPSGRWM